MPDPNIRKLSRNENIPRPYVIKPPLERKTLYLKDELIKYEMVIFGRAIDFLPYILITLKSAAQNGLGKNRGRAYLERIHQKNPVTGNVHELFSSENDMVYPRDIFFTENDFKTMDVDRVRLNFKTPAVIKDRGKFIQTPAFDTLIKRIRDRFSALSWFYEGIEPDIDFKNFTVEAEKVKTVRADVAYMQTYRRTRNPSAKQNMSGFVGSLIYQGPISQYMPYLLFGQYMHVGKAAVFGNGWYEAEV
ncbi:MAG: CRISPR system precrRNA processing endoribonuclease RAMP protein Cas6 [Spirochaetota bacterium]|nr:CRISPR system precrRNA processing endoribonuclease RAMP protein Cas6 [Spirochaetota bacterium]